MKPFLIIQSRPEDDASNEEYQSFLKFSGLKSDQLVRIRGEKNSIASVDLNKYSGLIIGGGPFNILNPNKSDDQLRLEKELHSLFDQIVELDYPTLAVCYGLSVLVEHQGGTTSTKYGEQIDGVELIISKEGLDDNLLKGLDNEFTAFLGHTEACEELPRSATILASSNWCPVQMLRVKSNIYATQFHPELDIDGIILRITVYKNHGYFKPEEYDDLISIVKNRDVSQVNKIISNFVKTYSK